MPTLQAATFSIPLKTAKTNGLAELGVPLVAEGPDATLVKKGKLAEAMQMLDADTIGRRYQNLRATLLRATEGGKPGVTLVLAFEIFGDDNAPVAAPAGATLRVLGGGKLLAEQAVAGAFLPYASAWYDNRHAVALPLDAFDAADEVQFVVAAEDVRKI